MAAPKPAGKQASSGQQGQGGKNPQAMAKGQQSAGQPDGEGELAMSKEQQQREAQEAAQTAMEARKKADYYAAAAAGAGDADERQKLINKKLDEEMRAETFGKTAKYIQSSGSFQGFAAGAGLGVGLGAVLGTLTGTLVGGPVGMITGGIGAGVGKLYGPFVNVAEWGGNKLRSITGDLPGWKATEDQKKALEHMCGQISETEAPSPEELESIAGDRAAEASQMWSDGKATGKQWKQSASSAWSNATQGQQAKGNPSSSSGPPKPKQASGRTGPRKLGKPSSSPQTGSAGNNKPTANSSQPASKSPSTPSKNDQAARKDSASPANETRKKPRKLEPRSSGTPQAIAKSTGPPKQASSTSTPKGAPKKLETRS